MRGLERLCESYAGACNLLSWNVNELDRLNQVDCARRYRVGRSTILATGLDHALNDCILVADLDGLACTEALYSLNLNGLAARENDCRQNGGT